MWSTRLGVLGTRLAAGARRVALGPRSDSEHNTRYLYTEIVLASLLSAAAAFNTAYILRLGGSNTLVGLLTSIPALVAVFAYLPSARILERQSQPMPWVVGSLFLARLGYLFVPLLPFILRGHVAEATVVVLISMQLPAVFFATAWSPLLSDIIPQRSRATVLAWRSILSSAAIAPLIFLAGRWLDRGEFPGNYQLLYAVGFAGGLLSTWLVSRIRVQPQGQEPAPLATPYDKTLREKGTWLEALRVAARENRGFGYIVVNTLVYSLGAWLVSPLFIIYYVRELGATDGWVGLLGTVAHVGVISGYWLWRRVIRRIGDDRTLKLAAPLMFAHPLLIGLVPNLSVILGIELLMNLVASGVNLSHSMLWLDLLPARRKHSATAIYSMIMNVGAFVCPLLGVAIADRIGIVPTLFIAAALRLLGAGLFYLYPVKRPDSPEPGLGVAEPEGGSR